MFGSTKLQLDAIEDSEFNTIVYCRIHNNTIFKWNEMKKSGIYGLFQYYVTIMYQGTLHTRNFA